MSSPSPHSSSSPPPRGSKAANNSSHAASDANIRNFAPVARIMKLALPENAKIAKEAKECMQECVSEFISFITSEGTFFKVDILAKSPEIFNNCLHSVRKMPTGKEKDGQWGGHPLCYDFSWLRELCRSIEDLSFEISRGKLPDFS
jgi:hypothetical protein